MDNRGARSTLFAVRGFGEVLIGWSRRLPALYQDALLYFAAAALAFLTSLFAINADYWTWGLIAGVAYASAALVAVLSYRWLSRGVTTVPFVPPATFVVRKLLVLFVIVGAVLAPLAAEVTWRAQGQPGAHAQAEVAVIERAGDRVAAGHSPYLARPTEIGGPVNSDSRASDSGSYFPYLPGMAVFGLVNALPIPTGLIDARLLIVLFTFAVTGFALWLSKAPRERRLRVVQVLIALPVGALPLATGGDDLPVIALVLLGLVFAARRNPVLAGVVFGLAATLKFTAWPILLLMAIAARDRNDRRAWGRYLLSSLVVVVPVIALGFVPSPRAFVTSVIRFPLGFTPLRSPAASPLLGQALTTILPAERRPITFGLLIVGLLIVAAVMRAKTPRTTAEVAGFAAFCLLVATILAPATRFGYLIYPVDLAVFAYVVADLERAPRRRRQSWSLSSTSWSETFEPTVAVPPPSSGEIADEVEETATSSSQ
jgi:hypothetical protein